MNKIEMLPFEIEHARQILVRPEQYNEKAQDEFEKWARINKEGGQSLSAFYGDILLGCAGVRKMWEGVGEAWAIFSRDIVDFKKDAYVVTGRELYRMIDEGNFHRTQAHVDATFPLAVKFIEGLGFKKECLMRKFQPNGNDSFLYSIVR